MKMLDKLARFILPNGWVAPPAPVTVDGLFMEQRAAVQELMARRKKPALKRSVHRELTPAGQAFAEKLTRPSAVLFRQVASPTNEILRFLRIADHAGLYPIILEYHGDKFVSAGNAYKRSLGKMPLYKHTGLDGRDIVEYRTIVDFNSSVGKPLSFIRCKDGRPLIEFHHELLAKVAGIDVAAHCIDATAWFQECGGNAHGYYRQFLSLFVRDGVLFEVVLPTASEEQFVRTVMMPAFQSVEESFRHRPLLVELMSRTKATRIFWDAYPKEVGPHL